VSAGRLNRQGDSVEAFGDATACSVVICSHDEHRRGDLRDAVQSVLGQTHRPEAVVVVVDHNLNLLDWVRTELPGVVAIGNDSVRGASAARNTGVAATTSPLVAFLDDDAVATPTWLAALVCHYVDPRVVGTGGWIHPAWAGTGAPRWFPPEFLWVVGGSYRGLPRRAEPVRNVWTGSMTVRRDVFETVGGFLAGYGKLGAHWGSEDTEFCLRAARSRVGGRWMFEPAAEIDHKVPASRTRFRFFVRRCYIQGADKAELAALHGTRDSTSTETEYVIRVLPRGLARGLTDACQGDLSGLGRVGAIAVGLAAVAVGYVAETLRARRAR
jgi:GT2 family glycosyltransferase